MLSSCADDAASKAEKEMMTIMVRDAERREQRTVDRLTGNFGQRDKRVMEHLDGVVKEISESLEERTTNLEAKMQTAFEKKWEEKIVEPDSNEGAIALAEYRIRTSVQTEMEKIWPERMEKEDKITTHKYETLNSQVPRATQQVVKIEREAQWQRCKHCGCFLW